MTHITPALTKEMQENIKQWERDTQQAAFIMVLEQSINKVHCHNCCGDGRVYVRYCKGPWPDVGHTKATYFDGDGRRGKGWYTIMNTQAYICGACGGTGYNQDYKPNYTKGNTRPMRSLAKEKSVS